VTSYAPVYRLVVYQARSSDPNEPLALTPVAGAPHSDYFKVTTGPAATGPTKPTAAMLSHIGMTVFTAANCVDGNLANTGWGTDSAVSGATLQVDLGAGVTRKYQICRIYVLTGTYAGLYDVEYSDNGSSWTKAVTAFKPTVGDNWHSCIWQDAGAHRYWRILLTNTPGAGPELAELEFWESDGPGDWKPYLFPPSGRRGRVDFLTKRTDVGVMSFRVGNPALAASDPLTRWFAAFSGDVKGKLRLGNLRAAAWESLNGGATFTPFWSGRVRTCDDGGGPAAYDLGIRELVDDMQALVFVGRPHASVTQAGFATLAPLGAGAAYGMIPAATPLTGTMAAVAAGLGQGVAVLDTASAGRADNLVTKNLLDAVAQPPLPAPTASIQIIWPTFTGPARARLKRLDTLASGVFKCGLVGQAFNGSRTHYRAVSFWLQELPVGSVSYLAMPPNATNVEITIEAEHYATDETPIFIDGLRWPQLWRLLLEGKFGYLWASPETLPPGRSYGDPRIPIPYHAAKFAALEADERFPPGRWLVRKREPRGMFIERENRIANLAYYRDAAGVVVPVDLRLPSDVSAVPTIADADLVYKDPPQWRYDRGRAITRVDGVHYTDLQQTVADLNASQELYPTIQGGGLQELRHPISILNVGSADLGDAPYALDATGFRAMPGEVFKDQSRSTYLERRLVDLSTEIARPYAIGATVITLPCARGGNGDTQPGELRKLAVKAIVDPGTNKHGGTRLVRVAERTEQGPLVALVAEDLGLSTTAQTPTLGAPAQEAGNTTAGLTTAVTLGAGGHPVEVHYAITPTSVGTAPVDADASWTPSPDGLVRASVTIAIRQLQAGKRVWVRGRSFPDAQVDYKLPSAWVAAGGTGRVDLAALAAPSAPAGSLQTAKSFRVSWTAGAADLATEILLATPTTDPRVLIGRALPGSTFFDIPGDVDGLTLVASTTYRVEVRHVAQDGAISAGVTVDIATTGVTTNAPDTGGIAILIGKP